MEWYCTYCTVYLCLLKKKNKTNITNKLEILQINYKKELKIE